MFLCIASIGLTFSGNGSGTEADPYQITNVLQFQEMNDEPVFEPTDKKADES